MPVVSGSDYRTGRLDLPARVKLRERDSKLGSYPTIARTGDPDFSGKINVFFDDAKTVVFEEGVTVSYPTLLPPHSQYLQFITESVATPNLVGDIHAVGTVRQGIADEYVHFTPTESLGPFREHLYPFPNSGSFYLTGTDPAVLPGFSSRLASKTIIKIPLTVKTGSSVLWSIGHNTGLDSNFGTQDGVHSGISYFDFVSGTWAVLGVDETTTPGWSVDYVTESVNRRGNSYLAFRPGFETRDRSSNPKIAFRTTHGRPTDTCGFPVDDKFRAGSDQTFKVSNVINHPFAVEKALLVWTGSVNLYPFLPFEEVDEADDYSARMGQKAVFFIMNQFPENSAPALERESWYVGRPGGVGNHGLFASSTLQPVSSIRDLLCYARLAALDHQAVASTLEDLQEFERPEWLYKKTTAVTNAVTGSFAIPMNATVPGKIGVLNTYYDTLGGSTRTTGFDPQRPKVYFTPWSGGRDAGELKFSGSGRSMIKPFVASQQVSSTIADIGSPNPYTLVMPTFDGNLIEFKSPYVLFPGDELIFGVANQPAGRSSYSFGGENASDRRYNLTFAPGESYVLLIGSMIRNGGEYHENRNQPLTSDAVHEALHYDNPVIDQYQVEALTIYSGSYIDDIVAGSLNAGTRGVVASNAAGTQGTTGSLKRGVDLVDNSERYYDTALPNLVDLHKRNVIGNLDGYDSQTYLILATAEAQKNWSQGFATGANLFSEVGGNFPPARLLDSTWPQSFPFESRYAGLDRDVSGDLLKQLEQKTGSPRPPEIFYVQSASYSQDGLTGSYSAVRYNDADTYANSYTRKAWFGWGKRVTSGGLYLTDMPLFDTAKTETGATVTISGTTFEVTTSGGQLSSIVNTPSLLRGWKYGIFNVDPINSRAVYRCDRYGQFRDQLEPRPDARFIKGSTIIEAPVVARFVDRDTGLAISANFTSSSNKSEFATSSVPYVDGASRN